MIKDITESNEHRHVKIIIIIKQAEIMCYRDCHNVLWLQVRKLLTLTIDFLNLLPRILSLPVHPKGFPSNHPVTRVAACNSRADLKSNRTTLHKEIITITKTALSSKCFNQSARPHSVSVVSRRCGTWMDRLAFPTAPPAVGRTSFTNMQML